VQQLKIYLNGEYAVLVFKPIPIVNIIKYGKIVIFIRKPIIFLKKIQKISFGHLIIYLKLKICRTTKVSNKYIYCTFLKLYNKYNFNDKARESRGLNHFLWY